MKVIGVDLVTHYQGGTTSVAYLLRIERTDGLVFGFTSASADTEEVGGLVYSASPGLDVTNVVTAVGLGVDNLELTAFHDETIFTTLDVLSSVWRNAEFLLSKYNWRASAAVSEALLAGVVGNVTIQQDKVVAELLGLQQFFQQTVVDLTSKTCRARFGDAKCTKDLAPLTFTAAVTTTNNQQSFTASALGQASDYFGNGELRWLTGDNAGLRAVVKSFASGVVTLMLPMFAAVQLGDTFDIVKGCRKRMEDCQANDNILNMQAEPQLPGIDALTKPPA